MTPKLYGHPMPWAALAFLLLSTGGADAAADESVALPALKAWSERSHCPSMDMLNAASRFHHGRQFQSAFLDEYYAGKRDAAGLPTDAGRDDIRLLTTNRDFVACQKLNRWFEANVLYDADHVHDAERDEYLPYAYPLYYRVGQRYAILFLAYNAGHFSGAIPPPPIPARVGVFVFDKDFGELGRFSL